MRQVIVLSVALTASLVGTYLTWTDDGEEITDGAVVVLSGSPEQIQSLTWAGEDTITITRKEDARGAYLWVEAVERKKKPVKDDTDHPEVEEEEEEPSEDEPADEPEAEEEPEQEFVVEEKTTRFLGNTQAQELWDGFAPLEALRELEVTPEMSREAFGFEEPTAKLTVQRKGQPAELTLGAETYGSKDRYLEHDGHIYLVDDTLIRPLQFATSRLVERTLQPIAEKDVTKVEVSLPDSTVAVFEQHERRGPVCLRPNHRL